MNWINAIIEAIKQLFSLGEKVASNKALKIPLQKTSIEAEAEKDAARDKVRKDRIEDRDLRKEPKDYLEYNNEDDFLADLPVVLQAMYVGEKSEILRIIKRDYADVLTLGQKRKFLKDIRNSDSQYFIIRIAPQT